MRRVELTEKGQRAAHEILEMYKSGLDVEEIAAAMDMPAGAIQLLVAIANELDPDWS